VYSIENVAGCRLFLLSSTNFYDAASVGYLRLKVFRIFSKSPASSFFPAGNSAKKM
jgi:hypothetical protein